MSTTMTRRALLARTPSVIAIAATAATPVVALAADRPADEKLVSLKAEYDDALRLAEIANDRHNAVCATVPN